MGHSTRKAHIVTIVRHKDRHHGEGLQLCQVSTYGNIGFILVTTLRMVTQCFDAMHHECLDAERPGNQREKDKMAMTVEIKGNKLCIEIDLEKPTPSSSGKTLVVASSRGNAVTTAMVDGKPVTIGLNAYIKP